MIVRNISEVCAVDVIACLADAVDTGYGMINIPSGSVFTPILVLWPMLLAMIATNNDSLLDA
jgi:hypothetical protein